MALRAAVTATFVLCALGCSGETTATGGQTDGSVSSPDGVSSSGGGSSGSGGSGSSGGNMQSTNDGSSDGIVDASTFASNTLSDVQVPDAFPASCSLADFSLVPDAGPGYCAFTPADVACNSTRTARGTRQLAAAASNGSSA